MAIKAIDTVFAGDKFRSRLEARWAVFFTAMRVEYWYEREGYDLGDEGYYLPDFWLPKLNLWVEIKAGEPTREEIIRCRKLADLTGKNAVILYGKIAMPLGYMDQDTPEEQGKYRGIFFYGNFDEMYEPFGKDFDSLSDFLREKGLDAPAYDGTYACAQSLVDIDNRWFLGEHGKPHHRQDRGIYFDKMIWIEDKERGIKPACYPYMAQYGLFNPVLDYAYTSARQARFEHGETPLAETTDHAFSVHILRAHVTRARAFLLSLYEQADATDLLTADAKARLASLLDESADALANTEAGE